MHCSSAFTLAFVLVSAVCASPIPDSPLKGPLGSAPRKPSVGQRVAANVAQASAVAPVAAPAQPAAVPVKPAGFKSKLFNTKSNRYNDMLTLPAIGEDLGISPRLAPAPAPAGSAIPEDFTLTESDMEWVDGSWVQVTPPTQPIKAPEVEDLAEQQFQEMSLEEN